MKSLQFYTTRNIEEMPQYSKIPKHIIDELKVVGEVLPFKINSYVADNLIDWGNPEDDPIFNLTFLRREMLTEKQFGDANDVRLKKYSDKDAKELILKIRKELNPDPDFNSYDVPIVNDEIISGIQHKYEDTCIIFPSNGQTCHSYCTFCFRWPQFVRTDIRYSTGISSSYQDYIRSHKEIKEILITGGDPLTMSVELLKLYIEPYLSQEFNHIHTIRIGTKAFTYWPGRFTVDHDSEELLRFFEKIVKSGKHLAVMAHWNHYQELYPPMIQEAIRKVRNTGAVIRTQSPLLKHINDDPQVWIKMWEEQVKQGCVPYYTYVERLTGGSKYFVVPIVKAWEIFQTAYSNASGLCHTVRGPIMSTVYGKMVIDGVTTINDESVISLSFTRARKKEWTKIPFHAKYTDSAIWFDQLEPYGTGHFFFINPN